MGRKRVRVAGRRSYSMSDGGKPWHPCPECSDGRLKVADAVYADCDGCDAAILRNDVGL